MTKLYVIDRRTGKHLEEKVYGAWALDLLYGDTFYGRFLSRVISGNPIFSALFGWWHKLPLTKRKVQRFIEHYGVDKGEFLEEAFGSFNDFFIRKLKPEARPIANAPAVIPADGRYWFYQNALECFSVKGEMFDLKELLGDASLADEYRRGTMIMARLCPTDYHRFHFPIDCVPSESRLINGYLYSVNPVAIRKDIHIFTKNKRMITELESDLFGKVQFIEVGATNVGSICQTYTPGKRYAKGEEKGYFSFGASALVILFKHRKLRLDADLVNQPLELLCRMGERMGLPLPDLGQEP